MTSRQTRSRRPASIRRRDVDDLRAQVTRLEAELASRGTAAG
jgi:hypothetical protein